MALIIETGAEIASANSYATRAEFLAWALERGYTIADDAVADSYLVKSFDFIRGLEPTLNGELVTKTQTGAYPRYDLYINDFSWASSVVPQPAIDYQMSLALDINNGIDIHNPPASGSVPVKRSRVEGAVEEEYAVADAGFVTYRSLSNDLRAMLTKNNGGLGVSISMG